jgi:glycosyltransferase involved in cell wall biosynthesis
MPPENSTVTRELGAGRTKATPRFSVLITFHNQKHFVKDAMDSALAQKHASFEIVVVDDASSDGTPEALKEYGDRARISCLEKNVGACAARNHAASLATGEYLVFLDGDDAFLPWALETYDRVVTAKNPAFILAGMRWFENALPPPGEMPREMEVVEYTDYLRRDRAFGHSASAFIIWRKAFEAVNGWLVRFFPLEDVELALRLGTSGKTVQILSPATILHRAHASNTINNVLSFIGPTEKLIEREKQGAYPGGDARKFERRALIGGFALHWIKRSAKAGLRGKAARLFLRSWPMLMAGALHRMRKVVSGKSKMETIAF